MVLPYPPRRAHRLPLGPPDEEEVGDARSLQGALRRDRTSLRRSRGREKKTLKLDNGSDYTAKEFQSFLKEKELFHQTSIVGTPQRNGKAERETRTIKEKVRSLLFTAGIDERYWAQNFPHAKYLMNQIPSASLSFDNPFRFLAGHHDLDLLPPPTYGQTVWIYDPTASTVSPQSIPYRFLHFSLDNGKKAIRV
jgi:transposase InsO family protein